MPPTLDAHFLELPTQWSALKKAADGEPVRANENAWGRLLEYYLPAVRAYLAGCTRDPARTDELVQKFSVQFLSGGFRHARQDKGPFRHYLKRALSNLVRQEAGRREPFAALPDDGAPPGDGPADLAFAAEYVKTLLDGAWAALRKAQADAGTPYYDFLRLVVDNPDRTSEELAATASLGGPERYTAERFRKILSRARHKYATHLYEQVAAGLDDPTPDAVADELADLRLLSYCTVVVDQRRAAPPA